MTVSECREGQHGQGNPGRHHDQVLSSEGKSGKAQPMDHILCTFGGEGAFS